MAAAFRTFARLGYADGASGHISLRDPAKPELFWLNPYAKHFATIKASDLVLVDHEGRPQEPTKHKANAAGFIIYSSIHSARTGINAIHVCSIVGSVYMKAFGGIVFAQEEGERIAQALGATNLNLVLENHGLLTAGNIVDEAAAYFIALERACEAQIFAESAAANGIPKRFVGKEEAEYTYKCSGTPACMFM